MSENRKPDGGDKRSRAWWFACIWLAILLMAGCADPAAQPPSPLPVGIDLRLVTTLWQVVQVVHQDQEVQFDAVRPFYVRFGWDGSLFYNFGCRGGYYRMDLMSLHEYRLNRLVGPGVTCPMSPEQEEQYRAVAHALQETNRLSFQNDLLWLDGKDTQIALEAAEVFPSFPAAEPSLMLNRWRWAEGMDQEGIINIDALAPIFAGFAYHGQLFLTVGMEEDAHLRSVFQITILDSGGYVLTPASEVIEYREGAAAQAQRVLDALLATREYELHDNRLILRGENVEIVMEIERPVN